MKGGNVTLFAHGQYLGAWCWCGRTALGYNADTGWTEYIRPFHKYWLFSL